jgi:hypothetical protein
MPRTGIHSKTAAKAGKPGRATNGGALVTRTGKPRRS